MNSRTASYWVAVSAAIADRRRQVQPLEVRQREESRGTGRPGTGYSCSPETRSAARLVDDHPELRGSRAGARR